MTAATVEQQAGPLIEESSSFRVGAKSTNQSQSISLRTWPLGKRQIEMGFTHIQEQGLIKIPFKNTFPKTPSIHKTAFGTVEFFGIRVPMPIFLWSVEPTGFTVWSLASNGWISYLAIEF